MLALHRIGNLVPESYSSLIDCTKHTSLCFSPRLPSFVGIRMESSADNSRELFADLHHEAASQEIQPSNLL